ncbi:MAG: dppC3 [Oscillospiraceae bacterium]|nr:dppC3 [Oscillospiraceae bacterium]
MTLLKDLFQKKTLGGICLVILIIFLLLAIFADVIVPTPMVDGSLSKSVKDSLIAPFTNWSHPLGTDRLGQDLLSYMIYGARTSVILCVCCTILSTIMQLVIGVLSAVFGGWFDLIVQRVVDAVGCIPMMLLLLLMMSMMGNGIPQLIIALAVPSGIAGSRMVRSAAISVKDSGYCNNSDLLGGTAIWKSVKHVVPNIMPLIIINAAGSLGSVVMMEASMNFLGYGVSAGTPSWGALITGQGREMLFKAPWLCIVPGLAITILTFSACMFGDAIRDLLDPRLKGGVGSYNTKKLDKILRKLDASSAKKNKPNAAA